MKPKAGRQASDLASRVPREVLDHSVGPPAGFGGDIGRLSSPFRRGDGSALCPVQPDLALVAIEVGDHAKNQAFARSRRAGDGGARAGAEIEVERAGNLAAKLFHHQCRLHRISLSAGGLPAVAKNSCTTNNGFLRYRISLSYSEGGGRGLSLAGQMQQRLVSAESRALRSNRSRRSYRLRATSLNATTSGASSFPRMPHKIS